MARVVSLFTVLATFASATAHVHLTIALAFRWKCIFSFSFYVGEMTSLFGGGGVCVKEYRRKLIKK